MRSDAAHLLCPSCDADPSELAGAEGRTCPACGASLIAIDPAQDPTLGQVIDGRFEIRARLGEGGMGTVYRAWQRSVGREVAIKLIDRHQSRDVTMARRFLREARLTSQLNHPSTVSIYDFGQCADGRLFIAMELVRGRSLDRVLAAEGAFPVERAVHVGVQICDALVAAHALDIVHRDLKLENIMILDEPAGRDRVKVLDFGIAKSLVDTASRSTRTGLIVGTPRYMAPEHLLGAPSTVTCDLYALGVVLAELVLARALWPADAGLASLAAAKQLPSPLLGELPEPLLPLFAGLVDPEPARRPTSAAAVHAALLAIDGGAPPTGGARGRDSASGRASALGMAKAPTSVLADAIAAPRPADLRVRTPESVARTELGPSAQLPAVTTPGRTPKTRVPDVQAPANAASATSGGPEASSTDAARGAIARTPEASVSALDEAAAPSGTPMSGASSTGTAEVPRAFDEVPVADDVDELAAPRASSRWLVVGGAVAAIVAIVIVWAARSAGSSTEKAGTSTVATASNAPAAPASAQTLAAQTAPAAAQTTRATTQKEAAQTASATAQTPATAQTTPTTAQTASAAAQAATAPTATATATAQTMTATAKTTTASARAAAPPATIELTFRSRPSRATVLVDGEAIGTTPLAVSLPRAGTKHRIELVHAGYATRSRELVFDRDHTLEVVLSKLPQPPRRPARPDPDGATPF